MRIFVLTEEHWAADGFRQVRLGLYASRALAEEAAEVASRATLENCKDPENYSYCIESDLLVRRGNEELVVEPGRSWRRWPALAEGFAAV
jgi:hypothetical protein